MAVVLPNIEDNPTYNAMAVRDAVDWYALGSQSLGTGVVTGMTVTGTGAMGASVASGSVSVSGSVFSWAGGSVTVGSASTADRRDTLVYRSGSVVVIPGSPCSVTGALWTTSATSNPPIKATLVQTAGGSSTVSTLTDVVLAEIYVAYNATTITSSNLVDKTNVEVTQSAPAYSVTGLTSATQSASRFVGATSSGPPATGTWTKGDVVVDYTGTIWVCTNSGNVGTWTPTVSSALYTRTLSSSSSVQATTGELTIVTQGSGTSASVALPSGGTVAQNGALYQIKNLSPNPVTIFGPTGTNSASVSVSGTVYAPGVAYTIPANTAYTFNYSSSVWYCVVTTDLAQMGNTLPVAKGGTGATTASAALVNLGAEPLLTQGIYTNIPTSTGGGSLYYAPDDNGGALYADIGTVSGVTYGWRTAASRGLLASMSTAASVSVTTANAQVGPFNLGWTAGARPVLIQFNGSFVLSASTTVLTLYFVVGGSNIASVVQRSSGANVSQAISFSTVYSFYPNTSVGVAVYGVASTGTATLSAGGTNTTSNGTLTVIEV